MAVPRSGGHISAAPPTLADVAELAGVSRQTVSNAVNNPDLLRADTLARVQDAIDKLGYQPNRAARSLRTRASHLIGLRMPALQEGTANAMMDRFVHTFVEAAAETGYHVLLFYGDPADPLDGYDELLRSTAVDAFVVTDTHLGGQQTTWLQSRRARFVSFGRPWTQPDAKHPWVDVDLAYGAEIATEHLIERGHSKIAWIGWHKDSLLGEERRSGWIHAMHTHGLSTTGLASRTEDSISSGKAAADAILDETEPTALVCASDTLAMGVLHALFERRLRLGEDIAVVGFDDSQVAQTVPPGITSVRPPLEEAARELVKALEELLATPSYAAPGVMLKPALTVRGSS